MGETNLQPVKSPKKIVGIAIAAVAVVVIAVAAVVLFVLPNSATAKVLTERLDLGAKYLAELNYEQAELEYLAAIEIEPKSEDAYLGLADVYIALGDYEMAKEILEKGLSEAKSTSGITEKLEYVCGILGVPMPEVNKGNSGGGIFNNGGSAQGTGKGDFAVSNAPAFSESTAVIGNSVVFGSFEQDNNFDNGPEAIEWMVLDVKEGQALLLSKYCLDSRSYGVEGTNCSYSASGLRKWLNGDFYESAFTEQEKKYLINQDIGASIPSSDGFGYEQVLDKVSLLSQEQAAYLLVDDSGAYDWYISSARAAKATPYAKAKQINELMDYDDAAGEYRPFIGCSDWYLRMEVYDGSSFGGALGTVRYVNYAGIIVEEWDSRSVEGVLTLTDEGKASKILLSDYMGVRPCIVVSMNPDGESLFSVLDTYFGPYDNGMGNPSDYYEDYTGENNWDDTEDYNDDYNWDDTENNSGTIEFGVNDLVLNSLITFGSYEQDNNFGNGLEPIEWRVFDVQDGIAYLISEKILDSHYAGVEYDRSKFDLGGTYLWEVSTLRKWLNEVFYNNAFSSAEKEVLSPIYVGETIDWEAADTALWDNVTIMTVEQLNRCYPYGGSDWLAYMTEFAYSQGLPTLGDGTSNWWVREDGYRSWVDYFGYINSAVSSVDEECGVRPCIAIPIE